ncbi:UPF0262 family protein [Temperatibacter marinus]
MRRSADVDHERRVAIFDLIEDNSFEVIKATEAGYHGPYKLTLAIEEGRLVFDLVTSEDQAVMVFKLAMSPFRRTIREYLSVCDRYYEAIKSSSPSQIEAIDMGRRGLHNDGSALLRERLEDKIILDHQTARRLFTLICVLHMKG